MREKLANRRSCESFSFVCNNLEYVASIGRFPDGRLAEVFLGNGRAGSDADAAAKDSAVVASIALGYGVPAEIIQHALLRDGRGVASSPLGAALDKILGEETAKMTLTETDNE